MSEDTIDLNVGSWQVAPESIGSVFGKKYRTQLEVLRSKIDKFAENANPREAFVLAFDECMQEGYALDFGPDTPLLQYNLARSSGEVSISLSLDNENTRLDLTSNNQQDFVEETTVVQFPVLPSPELPFDFDYELQLAGTNARHRGHIFLNSAIQQPNHLGGTTNFVVGSVVNIVDDLYASSNLKTHIKYKIPIARIVFRAVYNGPSQPMRLQSVQLVVHYEPKSALHFSETHLDHVINAGVGAASYASMITTPAFSSPDIDHHKDLHDAILNKLDALLAFSDSTVSNNRRWSLMTKGSPRVEGEAGALVYWGRISQLAIGHAIIRLIKDPNDLIDNTFISRFLSEADDPLAAKLLNSLKKIYGEGDILPSLRDFLLNATGLTTSLLTPDIFEQFGNSVSSFFAQLSSGKTIDYVDVPENVEELTLFRHLSVANFGQLKPRSNPIDSSSSLNIVNAAILACIILRLGQRTYGKEALGTAQDVISRVLGLEGKLLWDVVPSPQSTHLVQEHHSIFTLGMGAASSIETLGQFVSQFISDLHLTKHLLTLPVHGYPDVRTASFSISELDNNVQVFFLQGGFLADSINTTTVVWCPQLHHFWAVFDLRFLDNKHGDSGTINQAILGIFQNVFNTFASDHPRPFALVPRFGTHPGERSALTTNDILEDRNVDMYRLLNLNTPFLMPVADPRTSYIKGVRFFRDPESPNTRIIVKTLDTNVPLFSVVFDSRTKQFLRLGEYIDDTVRVVHADPVKLNQNAFYIKDNVYYNNTGPITAEDISTKVSAYQSFEKQNPFGSSSSAPQAPLISHLLKDSIHNLSLSSPSKVGDHYHGVHRGRGYRHRHHYYPWPALYAEGLALNAASGLVAQEMTGRLIPPSYVYPYYGY